MLIEVHILQNFAPSNLNRDDTNTPKDCEFGGIRRARISSQCLKRAIRLAPSFARTTQVELGSRTKWLVRLLSERLQKAGKPSEQIANVVPVFVTRFLSKLEKDKVRTAVLLYLSADEMDEMTKALLESWPQLAVVNTDDQGKAIDQLISILKRKVKATTSAPDIAMFGRMLAEKPELNLEAACQVAHAISTHRVTMEMDFYTAVDDLQKDEETGAGMMGFTGYNSACFYRYATIHWEQLLKNLNGEVQFARKTVEAFLRASVEAVPTGKQTNFAANNPPSFLLAAVRESGAAWSLANAFEKPVHASRDGGYVAPSVLALDDYWSRLVKVYGTQGNKYVAALSLNPDLSVHSLADTVKEDFEVWIGGVIDALPKG